jgi:hypothetical protein
MSPAAPRTAFSLAAVLAALVLTGCSGGPTEAGAPATTAGSAPTTAASTTASPATSAPGTTRRATTTTTTGGSPATPTTTPNVGTAKVVLRADGLSDVRFGTAKAEALRSLEELIGPGQAGEVSAYDCGQGMTATNWDVPGLTAVFVEDKMVGWSTASTRKVGLQTAEGVGANATVGQFRAAYGTRFSWFEGSTLGHEFSVKATADTGFAGVAKARGDDAMVENLWAGVNCIAR